MFLLLARMFFHIFEIFICAGLLIYSTFHHILNASFVHVNVLPHSRILPLALHLMKFELNKKRLKTYGDDVMFLLKRRIWSLALGRVCWQSHDSWEVEDPDPYLQMWLNIHHFYIAWPDFACTLEILSRINIFGLRIIKWSKQANKQTFGVWNT